METAIQTVVKVYLKSTKGKDTLGGKDFQGLVKSQLSNIMTDTDSKDAIAEMRQGLDDNQDGKVSFEEYMKLVGYLATSLSQQRSRSTEDPLQSGEAGAGTESTAPAQQQVKKAEEAVVVTPAEKAKEEVKPAAPAVAAVVPAPAVEGVAEVVEKVAEAEAKPAAPTAEEDEAVVVEVKSEEAS